MKTLIFGCFLIVFAITSLAQPSGNVIVDKNGVMRWDKSKEEVRGFGVNYTAMFAHAYRTAGKRGISLEQAMDEDIYHFARLGFDFYRVHVWDTEISDSVGNLLNNDHLKLFDFALARMKARGFNFMLTPIAFWGNGWPEPDDKTPGFSAKYGKDACLTNPEAIKAQQNYLKQFLNHVNPNTGIAYKNDPSIIAFEVSNEPHHRESPEKVTAFIKGMVDAMRSTGTKTPIFYNVSHSVHLSEAYAKAGIQGGTYQWYPTGLGAAHELGGNLLPNVDKYAIPFAATPAYKKMAKVVYEFDAADVGRSYIYPAMARSFREVGIQVATHFAYDPTYMADVNTEYGTHYMNLVYAPQKALSLKLANEVFHRVPMNKSYGGYPSNTKFESFNISYEKDLAEMVTATEFYYTNSTSTSPSAPQALEHIAGSGDSPVVAYEGTGAYFLDRIDPGVWRLEVLPDAVWTSDPFAPANPKKKVAVIHWREWPMSILLPDLGDAFEVTGLNKDNAYSSKATSGTFAIRPGTYLLTKAGTKSERRASDKWKNITLGEFAAPPSTVNKTHVVYQPPSETSEGNALTVTATIVCPNPQATVGLHVLGRGRGGEWIPMERKRNYQYSATIPASKDYFRFFIIVWDGKTNRTFPTDVEGGPRDWDFDWRRPYEVPILGRNEPLILFDARQDANQMSRTWLPGSGLTPFAGGAELQIPVKQLFTTDNENPNGPRIADYSMRYHFGRKISARKDDLARKRNLVFTGRSLNEKETLVQVALITRQGHAYGAMLTLEPGTKEYTLALTDLKPVKLVTLPRPYPTFLPYFFEGSAAPTFNIADVETLQLSIGPGLSEEESKNPHGFVIRSVRLD